MDQDEISSLDSYSSDNYKRSSPIDPGPQTEPIQSKIIVKISFQLEIHQKRGPLYLSESLQPTSINRGPRAKPTLKK